MKSTQDYVLACQVIKRVIDEWDPYRLLAGGAPLSEFEAEVASVVRYVPRIRGSEDAAQAISEVFSHAFEPESFTLSSCRVVGVRLFEALRQAGLVTQQSGS